MVSIEVLNLPPEVASDTVTTFEDTPVSIDLFDNSFDWDGDDLAVSDVTQPAHGSVTSDSEGVTYTPDAGWTGTDSFTYTVSDGYGGTATATVTVAVRPPDSPPEGAPESYVFHATELSVPADVGVLANDTDADCDPLTAVLVDGPTHGELTLNPDGSFDYTPDANWSGTDSFTYRPSDGWMDGDPVTVTIALTNAVPTAYDLAASTQEGATVYVSVYGSDPDGDPLTLTAVTQGAHGTVVACPEYGYVSYTPDAGFHGIDTFTYTLADGFGGTATGSVGVTANAAPVANDDTFAWSADAGTVGYDVLANDTDPDGDSITITGVSSQSVYVWTDGSRVYFDPDALIVWTDPLVFTYTISDGHGGTATATVTIYPPG